MADDKKKESGIDAGRVALGGLAGLVLGLVAPPLGIVGKVIGSAAYTLVSNILDNTDSAATSIGEGVAAFGGQALAQYLNPLHYLNPWNYLI